MSCFVDYSFKKEYPETVEALFISKSGETITDTLEGIIEEMQKLGETSVKPVVREFIAVSDLSSIFQAQKVFVEKIQFYGYDVKELGGQNQTDATFNEIIASRNNDLVIPQSNYIRSLLPVNFQPNHFRPNVFIDGKPILTHETKKELPVALNAIGYNMPKCFEINLPVGKVNRIDILSALAQRIDVAKYINYFMVCEITFWVGYGN